MQQLSLIAVLLLGILGLASAQALAAPTDYAFSNVPSRFRTQELTAGSRALGEICLSRDQMPDGTVCNPAFLPELGEGLLIGRAFIGNGYTALSTADKFIYQPISRDFLQNLFASNNVTSVEAHASLEFASRYFSASFSPYRVQYVSEVHNPNFPVVAVHAAVERELSFAGGVPLSAFEPGLERYTAGARLRLVSRRFVHGSFNFFQAVSEDPQSLLPVQQQNVAHLETYVGWHDSKLPWSPRASVAVVNIGPAFPDNPLYYEPADAAIGVGVEPPLGPGRLRVGLDISDLIHAASWYRYPRLGSSYQYGIMKVMTGFNPDSVTGGIEFGMQIVQVGIVYEFNRADEGGGSEPEQRVSTEISVRL